MILVLIGLLAGYLAYSKEESELRNKMDQVMLDLNYGYENITEDFWRLYMPIWTYKTSVYSAIDTYFSENRTAALTPIEQAELMEAMRIIMSGDGDIRWIGVYRGKDFDNYLLFNDEKLFLKELLYNQNDNRGILLSL